MSATNAFETALLSLIFENADAANVGDATGLRGSSTAGVFYISLHVGSPADTGDQTTNEAAYTDYDRVSVARSTAQWTVTNDTADNDNAIAFPECTGSSSAVDAFGIGSTAFTDSPNAGDLFIHGTVSPTLNVSTGITPSFAAGALDVTLA
jgi:hypothetical protein